MAKKLKDSTSQIVIPGSCKISKACSTDRRRPVITHGYLRSHEGALWLHGTDSFIAAAVKVGGVAKEGFVPIGALRLMERGQRGEQISETAWKVQTTEGEVTFDCAAQVAGATFPDFATLGVFSPVEGEGFPKGKVAMGMNPHFSKRLGDALGATALRFEFAGPIRPIRVIPIDGGLDDRYALQMPVRINV